MSKTAWANDRDIEPAEGPPFVGICIGGPYAGKRMGSYDREQRIAHRDRLAFPQDGEATVQYTRGVYRYVDKDKEWHWRELD